MWPSFRRRSSSPASSRAAAALVRQAALLALSALIAACELRPARGAAGVAASDEVETVEALPLRVPTDAEMPQGDLGTSVRRGRALFLAARDSFPWELSQTRLRCQSCHLDDGMRAGAMPLVGVYARFPQYRSRSGAVLRLEDRINNCFTRSMNGRPLDPSSTAMRDMVAWLSWISRGYPVGSAVRGQGLARLEPRVPDPARGAGVYAASCARCHGAEGRGAAAPPLWGDGSYNVGASMAQLHAAAAFVRHNMPHDRPGTLNDQDAYDVAAFMNSHARPDFADKAHDWPKGDAPADAPYRTHAADRLTRADPSAIH